MDADQKRQVLNRLKSIEGHVRGIQRMVEEEIGDWTMERDDSGPDPGL